MSRAKKISSRAAPTRELVVRRAAPGEQFYTWRGALRSLHPFDGRLVLNAYRGSSLVGSALLISREPGPDDPNSSTWQFMDTIFNGRGPYFGDPDLIDDAAFLHFESLYVRRDSRRQGVSLALCEAIAEIGLPTFCELRPKFLPAVFERYRADAAANETAAWEWTSCGEGGSIACAMTVAEDGSYSPSGIPVGDLAAEIVIEHGGPYAFPANVDGLLDDLPDDEGGDALDAGEEGVVELDAVNHPGDYWTEDDSWVPRWIEEELRFNLALDRSGFELGELRMTTVAQPRPGQQNAARFCARLTGRVENAGRFALRAEYRRYLRTFDADWTADNLESALRELVRPQHSRVESVQVVEG